MFKVASNGFDKELFPELTTFIRTLPDVLHEEALELAVSLEAELVNVYSEAKPRGDERFVWSLDPDKDKAARGWWFANLREGNIPTDGKHYKRQGKPPYGARVDVQQTGDGVVITVTNTWSKSSYVFGQLNREGQNKRVPGHIKTGWQSSFPKYEKARKRLMRDLDSRILARLRGGR
jgi:hypothetical protein